MRSFVVLFTCASLLLVCGQAYAQVQDTNAVKTAADTVVVQTARNNVYLEILGSAYIESLNYEGMVSKSVCFRVSILPIIFGASTLSILIGSKEHFLELGGGISWLTSIFYHPGDIIFAATGVLGYRYQPLNGGFLFRVTFTPLIVIANGYSQPWGGISFGWNF